MFDTASVATTQRSCFHLLRRHTLLECCMEQLCDYCGLVFPLLWGCRFFWIFILECIGFSLETHLFVVGWLYNDNLKTAKSVFSVSCTKNITQKSTGYIHLPPHLGVDGLPSDLYIIYKI